MSPYSSFISTALAALLLTGTAYAATPPEGHDVAITEVGGVVRDTFGNCVRTKWMSKGTGCDPRYAQAQVQRKARSLMKAERTIYFDFNKANIRASEQPKLDTMADILKADNEVKSASIVGYADRMGTVSYNERLSQSRAQMVENYLHQRGYLNTSLAKTRWLGESEPVTQCAEDLSREDKIACLQPDRRVEVEIEFVPTGNSAPQS